MTFGKAMVEDSQELAVVWRSGCRHAEQDSFVTFGGGISLKCFLSSDRIFNRGGKGGVALQINQFGIPDDPVQSLITGKWENARGGIRPAGIC